MAGRRHTVLISTAEQAPICADSPRIFTAVHQPCRKMTELKPYCAREAPPSVLPPSAKSLQSRHGVSSAMISCQSLPSCIPAMLLRWIIVFASNWRDASARPVSSSRSISYAALGDSYASGDGAGSSKLLPNWDISCGRFSEAYPVQLANSTNLEIRLDFTTWPVGAPLPTASVVGKHPGSAIAM